MNPEQFTQKTQQAFTAAQGLMDAHQHAELGVPHLLLALLQQADGVVARFFREPVWTSTP